MRLKISLFILFLTFTCVRTATLFAADEELNPGPIEFREAVQSQNEKIDTFTGHLTLSYLDLELPADGELPLQIFRTFNSDRKYDPYGIKWKNVESILENGWDIHFGRIHYVNDNAYIELGNGYQTSVCEQTNPYSSPITNEYWILSPGPTARSKRLYLSDGTIITFGVAWIRNSLGPQESWYYATEIRKNNTVLKIDYKSNGIIDHAIDKVTYTTEGTQRTINFYYNSAGRLSQIGWLEPEEPGQHRIHYTYSTDSHKSLTSVTLPEGEQWRYTYANKAIWNKTYYVLNSVTTPEGGLISYTFDGFSKSGAAGSDSGIISSVGQISISKKTYKERDQAIYKSWTYDYKSVGKSLLGGSTTEPGDYTTVTEPCGRTIKYKFHGYGSPPPSLNRELFAFGMPVYKETYQNDTLESKEIYVWLDLIKDYEYSHPGNENNTYQAPPMMPGPVLYQKKIIRNGITYTTTYYNHDVYGRPKSIIETGSNTKTTTKTYWAATTNGKWIIDDRPLSVTVVGDATFPGTYTTTYTYYTTNDNRYGQVQRVSRYGRNTDYNYDTYGNLSSITDANGKTTSYTWQNGAVSKVTNPLYSISRVINPDGTVHSETNGRGNTTTYIYDKNARLIEIDPPTGNPTYISYNKDANGYLVEMLEQRGNFGNWTDYDGLGRVVETEDSVGKTTSTVYDDGDHLQYTDSNTGDLTNFNHLGRITKVTHKNGKAISYSYPTDTTVAHKDELGYATTQKYNHFGDPDDNLMTQIVNAYNQPTYYSYNALGKLTKTTQNGETRNFVYATGTPNLLSETHPEDGRTEYTRDAVGNLTQRTEYGAATIDYHYDALNRLIGINTTNDPANKRRFTYANNDKPATVTSFMNDAPSASPSEGEPLWQFIQLPNFVSRLTYGYDANERVQKITSKILGVTATTSYAFDDNDNVTQIDYPSGTTLNYTYNNLNQPTSILINGTTYISDVTYYTDYTTPYVGMLKSFTRLNGKVVSFTYSPTRQLDYAYYPAFTLNYEFDVRDNVAALSGPWTKQTFSYDALNRLVNFNGSWGAGQYEYVSQNSDDRLGKTIGSTYTDYEYSDGKLIGETVNGVTTTTYTYDNGDAVTCGNMVMTYDPYHNLIESSQNGNIIGEYLYNTANKRVYKRAGGKTTLYFHGKDNETLSEMDENGLPLTDYVYLNGKMVAKVVLSTAN